MAVGGGTVAAAIIGGLVLGGIGGGIAGGLAGSATSTSAVAATGNPTLDRWTVCLDWVDFVTQQQAIGIADDRINTTGALLSNKALSNEPDSVVITEGVPPTTPPVNNTEQRQTRDITAACGNAQEIRAARESAATYLDLLPPASPPTTRTTTTTPPATSN